MKSADMLLLALAAAAGVGIWWYLKHRNERMTLLSTGKIYAVDPAYDQAGY